MEDTQLFHCSYHSNRYTKTISDAIKENEDKITSYEKYENLGLKSLQKEK